MRDRPSGKNRGDREAFQRALKEQGEAANETPKDDEAPVRPALQQSDDTNRKDQEGHHVDVLA